MMLVFVCFFIERMVLLHSHIAIPMLKCAIASSTLMHREANSSVMRLLSELLNVKSHANCKDMVCTNYNETNFTTCINTSINWTKLFNENFVLIRVQRRTLNTNKYTLY